MGRGKLSMQLITNEKARRRTFEKRKKSLEKSAHELSTLCGVDIGMIIYGPAHSKDSDSDRPTIWPNDEVIAGLIDSYKSRPIGHDTRKRTYELSDFFKDQTAKVEDELRKLRKKTREIKYPMPNLDNCKSLEELKQFGNGLMGKIDAVRGRINMMKGSTSLFTESDVSLMNHSVQESGISPPQQFAYVDAQNEKFCLVPQITGFDVNGVQNYGFDENVGVECNSMYSFDQKPSTSSYAYGFDDENRVQIQNCTQPWMCYNVQNVQPMMMPYFVPYMVQMPKIEEIDFSQMHDAQNRDFVQMQCFQMGNLIN